MGHNGLLSSLVFVLVKTDPKAEPAPRGFTCFIAEKESGVGEQGPVQGAIVPPKIKKLGYKGVESTESCFPRATAARGRTSSAAKRRA